jgi:hypothetical protein
MGWQGRARACVYVYVCVCVYRHGPCHVSYGPCRTASLVQRPVGGQAARVLAAVAVAEHHLLYGQHDMW